MRIANESHVFMYNKVKGALYDFERVVFVMVMGTPNIGYDQVVRRLYNLLILRTWGT
jgi:hypothetical protein